MALVNFSTDRTFDVILEPEDMEKQVERETMKRYMTKADAGAFGSKIQHCPVCERKPYIYYSWYEGHYYIECCNYHCINKNIAVTIRGWNKMVLKARERLQKIQHETAAKELELRIKMYKLSDVKPEAWVPLIAVLSDEMKPFPRVRECYMADSGVFVFPALLGEDRTDVKYWGYLPEDYKEGEINDEG